MNRIGREDIIGAASFDKNDRFITSLYDSGFRNIGEVISALLVKGSGWTRRTKWIQITNEDRGWSDYYLPSGKKKQ